MWTATSQALYSRDEYEKVTSATTAELVDAPHAVAGGGGRGHAPGYPRAG
jgi:hypothetical protein